MERIEESQKYTLKELVEYPIKAGEYYFVRNMLMLVFANRYVICEHDRPLMFESATDATKKLNQMGSVIVQKDAVEIISVDGQFVRLS